MLELFLAKINCSTLKTEPKVTLKSLQFEVSIFQEELKATKEELYDVKEELQKFKI